MSEEDILRFIIKSSLSEYGTDGKKLNKNTHFANDLGIDSMEKADLVCVLENQFDVFIPDDVLERVATIEDLAKALNVQIATKQNKKCCLK